MEFLKYETLYLYFNKLINHYLFGVNKVFNFESCPRYELEDTKLPSTNGVYAIVNKYNDKFYIGSAADEGGFWKRFLAHRSDFW